MKTKATKLLSFILALTLLMSSFVIVGTTSSAADELTGKTTVANVGFGDNDTGKFTANLAGGTNTMGVVGDTALDPEIYPTVKTDPYYLFYYQPASGAVNTDEVSLDLTYAQPINLAGTSFVVVDFEFSCESALLDGFFVDLIGSRNGKTIEGGDVYFNTVAGTVYMDEELRVVDEDTMYAGVYTPYEWVHYTVVADVVNNVTYVYVDGEFRLKVESAFNGAATNDAFRIGFAANQAYVCNSYAFDNIEVNAYSADSNVNLASVVSNWEKTLADTNIPAYQNIAVAPVKHVSYPIACVLSGESEKYYYSAYELGKEVKADDYVELIYDHAILTPTLFRVAEGAIELVDENKVANAANVYSEGANFSQYINYYEGSEHRSTLVDPDKLAKKDGSLVGFNRVYSGGIDLDRDNVADLTLDGKVLQMDFYADFVHASKYGGHVLQAGVAVAYNLHGNKITAVLEGNVGKCVRFDSVATYVFNGGTMDRPDMTQASGATVLVNDSTIANFLNASKVGTFRANNCTYVGRLAYYIKDNGVLDVNFNHCVVKCAHGGGQKFIDIRAFGYEIDAQNKFQYCDLALINTASKGTNGFIGHGANASEVASLESTWSTIIENNNIFMTGQFIHPLKVGTNYYTELSGNKFSSFSEEYMPGNTTKYGVAAWHNGAGMMTTGSSVVKVTGPNIFSTTYNNINGSDPNGITSVVGIDPDMNVERKNPLPNLDPETNEEYPYYIGSRVGAKLGYYLTVDETQQLLVNLTLNSDLNFNLYIPTSLYTNGDLVNANNFLNYIKLPDGQQLGCSWDPKPPIVTLENGIEYYKLTYSDISPEELSNDFTFSFGGRRNNPGAEGAVFGYTDTTLRSYKVEKTFNILDYAVKAYAIGDAETKALMAEIVNYAYEAAKYTDADALTLAKIERAMYGINPAQYAPEATETNQAEIAEYVTGAYVALQDTPSFVFTVAQAAKVTLTYTDNATGNVKTATYDVAEAGTELYLELRAYNLLNTITIEVEGVGVGTYDLYTYIESQKTTNAYGLLKALYMYSVAAEANLPAAN